MEARQPWSSFNDRKSTSFNGRDTYKIPRMTAGSLPPPAFGEPYYNQQYGQSYVQPPGESQGEPSSAPLGSGLNRHHSDVSYHGYPKQATAQPREPWKQNATECLCCCPAHEGRMCATLAAALPGLMGAAAGQSGAGNKPFFQFPGNNNPGALSSFLPNFNTMDPVQKAVMKHTFGKVRRQDGKRKRPIRCDICKINFNSDSQAQAHYRGSRHAKKLKLEKTTAVPPKAPGAAKTAGKAPEAKLLYCSICKVSVNSLVQLTAHNLGGKHKSMLDSGKTKPDAGGVGIAATGSGSGAAALTLPKGSSLQVKSFQCETCNIHVNSEIQLKQHISSQRHTDRVAGKPAKPRFNKKQQAEEAMVVAGSSDESSPGSSSSQLRPAPGPVRAGQAPARSLPY